MPDNRYVRRLVLKDGTVLDNCECGYSNKMLWCFIKDIPFVEAFQYFSDSARFETIHFDILYDKYFDRITYSGMESIISVIQNEFSVDICLTGENIKREESRVYSEGGE